MFIWTDVNFSFCGCIQINSRLLVVYIGIMESITECLSRNSNSSPILDLFVEDYSQLKALVLGHHDNFRIITGRCRVWASTLWTSCYGTNV